MSWEYKTRNGSSPMNKRRVYFSCHSEDLDVFFLDIANEILNVCDCAVYFCRENSTPDENYFFNLSSVQLIVFPVTSKLLNGNNRSIDVDLKYAIENNIPVLPLMQEEGLEEKFNGVFGTAHFLLNSNKDATSIGYYKKLEIFVKI